MRIALCLSGELRRVDPFYPIIYKSILEPYNPDIFISTWDMPDGIPTSVANTKRNPTEVSTLDYVKTLYKPVGMSTQKYSQDIKDYLKQQGNTNTDNLLCMAFNIFQSYGLAHHRAIIVGSNYDLVIRQRFDYGIQKIKFEDYDLNKVNVPNEHGYGGYQDMFAFGNQQAMLDYSYWFVTLANIENSYAKHTGLPTNHNSTAGFPWHPESALKRYLDVCGSQVNLIDGLNIRYPWCTLDEIGELYD